MSPPAAPSPDERGRERENAHLWQLGDDFAELMIRDELPESQSLVGAMHQLLDALQGGFLIGLSLGCTVRGGDKTRTQAVKTSHNHAVAAFWSNGRAPALGTHCDISAAAPAGPAGSWRRPGA